MADILLPVGFAVFIWWFSTGLIIWLDRLPDTGVRWGLVLSSALAVAALFGLAHTSHDNSDLAAYCAFSCTLIIWGWHELTFLSGWLTGPRRHALSPETVGWPRFVQSVRAILWHELGLVAMGAAVLAVTWGASNTVGLWTFGVLWAMRLSAKLNLFFGVRNFSEAFLPPHLKYLQTFFRRRRMNAFFPLAVGGATWLAVELVISALDPALAEGARTGQWLVTSLLVLAIIEHWLLVLPLESTALWRWAIARGDAAAAKKVMAHAR
jgi:putative photosynthetic complex assembly protein 2